MARASEAQRFAVMYCCTPSYVGSVTRVFSSFRNSVLGRAMSGGFLFRLREAFRVDDFRLGDLVVEVLRQLLGQVLRGNLQATLDAAQVTGVNADGVRYFLQRLVFIESYFFEGCIHG